MRLAASIPPCWSVDSSTYSMLPTQQVRNNFYHRTEAERPVSSTPDSSADSTATRWSVDSSRTQMLPAHAISDISIETYICHVRIKKCWRPACSNASTLLSCSADSSRCAGGA